MLKIMMGMSLRKDEDEAGMVAGLLAVLLEICSNHLRQW